MTEQTAWAETWLREILPGRRVNQGLQTEASLITAMIERPETMRPVYVEIARQVPGVTARKVILESALGALADITRIPSTADTVKEADHLTRQITTNLHDLAKLFEQRNQLAADFGLSVSCGTGIDEWIQAALQRSDRDTQETAEHFIIPVLQTLSARYDGRYWPSDADLLRGIADRQPEGIAPPALLESGLTGYEGQARRIRLLDDRLDMVRGFFVDYSEQIPETFSLPDKSVTALLSIAGVDVDEENVRKTRNRLKR